MADQQTPALLTVAERERYAGYLTPPPIASHQREAMQARADAFPRLLSAYVSLDNSLAEAQGEFEELSRRLSQVEAANAELKQELAEQEVKKMQLIRELRAQAEALIVAGNALADCYDVTEWPADGTTSQDFALEAVRALFKPEGPAAAPLAAAVPAADMSGLPGGVRLPTWPPPADWYPKILFDSKQEYDEWVSETVKNALAAGLAPREPDECDCGFEKATTPEDQWIEDLFTGSHCVHCGGKIQPPAAALPTTGEGKEQADV